MFNRLDIEQLKLDNGYIPIGTATDNKLIRYSPFREVNNTTQSNTNTTLINNISLSINVLVAGTYEIKVSGLYATANANRDVRVVLNIDSVIQFDGLLRTAVTNYYSPFSFFIDYSFSIGTHSILLQFARGATATTAYLRDTILKVRQDV